MPDETLSTNQLALALRSACSEIIAIEEQLTRLDTLIGDGDHGLSMKKGFSELADMLNSQSFECAYDLFYNSGVTLLRSMGGASGVLFATLLIGGLACIRDKMRLDPDDLTAFFEMSLAAIEKRGRTQVGDKTMVDALAGAVSDMKSADGLLSWSEMAWLGAKRGAEGTAKMLPRAGRASNFREKALGYPDPGAVSVSAFFYGIYLYISEQEND